MRIIFYSPDSYGLGHVRRTLAISQKLLKGDTDLTALLLTGAPRAHYFSYPDRCDYVKLPSVTKGTDGRYVSREIGMPIDEIVSLRGAIIESATQQFEPDVFWVDHAPLGLCGEALSTLRSLGNTGVLRVLGLRDVIDAPEAVRANWATHGIIDVLRHQYDLILVYGQRDVFDPTTEYSFPAEVAAKTVFAGYIPRLAGTTRREQLLARYAPVTGRLVLVTVGGGGDGDQVVKAFLSGHERLGRKPPFETVLVTGPLMSPRKRTRFNAWGTRLEGITVLEFTHDLPALMRASSLTVSMGGYNTVCELAYAGARALLVPRQFPRREQLIRAERLAARGVCRTITLEEATPERLLSEVMASLDGPPPPRRWGLDFSGLTNTANALADLRGRSLTRSSIAASGARH